MMIDDKLVQRFDYLSSSHFTNLSALERECFAPAAFTKLGSTTAISNISELPFFACSMQEGRARDTVVRDLNGLSISDIKMLAEVIGIVVEMTDKLGFKTAPRASLLKHFFH